MREVLHLTADGHSNTGIAEHLTAARANDKTHVNPILAERDARHRVQEAAVLH